jgi:hypothetical protein
LTIEQDILRRRNSPGLPSEMPAELAALYRTTLTVGELAYLNALKGTNVPVTEAARKEAVKDQEERLHAIQKHREIATELAAATVAELERLQGLQKEWERLEARHEAADKAYIEKKNREKNMGGGLNDSVHPVVSITERAGKAKGG